LTAVFPSRALAVLTGLRIGYVATVRPDGRLSVVPVGVVREGEVLKISAPTSTYKVRNLQRDPRITVCVPDPERPTEYVEVRGVAELADDTDRAFIDGIARQYMGVDEYPHEPRSQARTTITVHPEQVSVPQVQGSRNETENRP
jgi:PPOX class probable F420-dependent enzyme